MDLQELERIDQYKHLAVYNTEEIYTKLCLYEPLLISTDDVSMKESVECDGAYDIHVSDDVSAYEKLWLSKDTILLPCAFCGEERPFKQVSGTNPKKISEFGGLKKNRPCFVAPLGSNSSVQNNAQVNVTYNVFQPFYTFGNGILQQLNRESDYIKNGELLGSYKDDCAQLCTKTILSQYSNLHKDLVCTLNDEHWAFFEFIIKPVVDCDEKTLIQLEEEKSKKMREKTPEKIKRINRTSQLYHKHKHSLLLMKVGQYPSLKNMSLFDYRHYRKILGDRYNDYTLSLALFADGIGAGSFVYLRRILESFVEEEHQNCLKEAIEGGASNAFDEESYKKLRFNEKMDLLQNTYGKKIIPSEIMDIKNEIYGVLSKGVHEYTEKECLSKYAAIKYIIDMIIEEKIHKKEKETRLKEMKNQIKK